MAAIIGLIIGYVLGTRAGDKGHEELSESWRTITTSQAFRDMLGGLFALIGEFLTNGRKALAGKLQTPEIDARSRELEQAA
jgi:hypothetical protein